MKQYIDKSALIAEIKKIEHEINYEPFTDEVFGKRYVCKSLLSFIDTLEVKEVNLENSVKGRIDYPLIGHDFPNIYPNYKELKRYCDKNGIKDEDRVKIIIIKDAIL